MGLDMFLDRTVFVGAEYESRKITGKIELYTDGKPIDIDIKKVSYVYERVAYWRKANAVHRWFVENFANGVDDCNPIHVCGEDLAKLCEICRAIWKEPEGVRRNEKAMELLPPQDGFFFGSTKIDEWYYEDLAYTLKVLDGIKGYGEYVYRASW